MGGRTAAKPSKAASPFREKTQMLAAIAVILIIAWALGLFAFHVTTGLIHIILVVAVIVLIMHFVTGRRSV
jgi:membrane protein YdbS with pleckstrin-like domain